MAPKKSKKVTTKATPVVPVVPVASGVKPKSKASKIVPFIMIPLSILLGWFIFTKISDVIETPSPVSGTPVLSSLDQCYKNAYDAYIADWLNYCRANHIAIY